VLETVRSFIQQRNVPYQNLIANAELEQAFGAIQFIPTTFFIDKNGKIAQTIVGGRSKEVFAEAISSLLK